jgi:hypothetical protein
MVNIPASLRDQRFDFRDPRLAVGGGFGSEGFERHKTSTSRLNKIRPAWFSSRELVHRAVTSCPDTEPTLRLRGTIKPLGVHSGIWNNFVRRIAKNL